jgi:hypothetical protein
MDVGNKPIDYALLSQYGLVKPRAENDNEKKEALNLYPRPSYNGGTYSRDLTRPNAL